MRGSKKVEDSFVKIENQYFQVTLIFKYKDDGMVLCEKIPVSRTVHCQFKGYIFKLDQLKIIDVQGWKEKTNFVFKLKQIQSHCLHVNIDEVFNHQ